MNQINLIGRLVAKPELRYTKSNIAVAQFKVAVDRGYGDNKKTDFFTIKVWNKLGETVTQYTDKGHKILVTGELQTNQYEDKDGNKRTAYEIVANSVEFLESKKDGQAPSTKQTTKDEPSDFDNAFNDFAEEVALSDDELPF